MNRSGFRNGLVKLVAGALVLGLAACGQDGGGGQALSGEPIERVAPPEGQSWSQIIEKTPQGGYRIGNPDAPIKLIEFASLTCPHCAHFSELAAQELKQDFVDSGRVSVEFRNFVMNPLDLTMAMLTRCGTTESFFALTEQTMANQTAIIEQWSKAGEAQIERAATQPPERRYQAIADVAGLPEFFAARGIAADQSKACLADAEAAETLVALTSEQAEEFDITGTPSFAINGQKAEVNTWPEVKAELEKLGAR